MENCTLAFTSVKVTYNREWAEWVVKTWVDGKRYPNADYHTNDKQDAEDTAELMRKEMRQ